jgi:alpha-mannosidase
MKRTTRVVVLATGSVLVLALGFAVPCLAQQKETVPENIKTVTDQLETITVSPVQNWKYHSDIPHPEDPNVSDADWPALNAKQPWQNGSRVLRRWIEIPQKVNGYDITGARVDLNLVLRSRESMIITVFSNQAQVARTDEDLQQPIPLTESAVPGQKFLIAVRVDARNVDTGIWESDLAIYAPPGRPDPGLLREEILSAYPMIQAYAEGQQERMGQLDEAVKAVDFACLQKADQHGFDDSLRQSQGKLEQLKPWLQQFTIRAVGNSHIDMAWLWPWTETVEVVRNTFQSVLDLMREYPDFKFTMSSAQAYEWIEQKYPDMFKQIQERVKEGRWEVIGGMWVEPDLNMPGGESLVRQILIGKRYFQQKFGVDVNIGWNPDSFGYNWQLPQIYKRSGIDYFVTQKLLWAQDYTKFPYRLFWWQAPDGSKLLTYFPHDYAMGIDGVIMANDLAFWSKSIYGDDINIHPEMMHLYGVGDHGGGPTRTMLDNAARLSAPNVIYPKLELSTATSFFQDLGQKMPSMKVPTWDDELYFQYHRGVFTTQAETKKRIRYAEELLLNAEKFSSLSSLYGLGYPSGELQRDWKRLLFDDFHDIFPGSGIAVNYLDAKLNLQDVSDSGRQILRASLKNLAAHVNTTGPGTPVVIFNSLSWPRNHVVEVTAQLPAAARNVEVVDRSGKAVPSQLEQMNKDTNQVKLLVLVSVPSLGYKTYYVRGAAQAPAATAQVKSSSTSLENDLVRVKIDSASGCMTSVFDKRSNIEALAPAETDSGGPRNAICGNLLQAFHDLPKAWDAWNIDADFEKQRWDIDKADEVKLIESGPLRGIIQVKQHFQNSTFVRDIVVTAGSPVVDVKTSVEWHEQHILLKVAFPLSAHNDKATFEIPYGTIERPTTRNTPAEQAEFEVPAIHWADLSDAKHGLSLLNDCKYGYDAKGNVLRLSLLRSPVWPDPHADQGHHEFTYAIYPHAGGWREALTVRRGYELNYPVLSTAEERHAGSLADAHSFLNVQADNVVVTAVKKAEDNDDLVIRFYEWAGKNGDVPLEFLPTESAEETNLMEKSSGPLPVKAGIISVPTKPYEIKTVEVHVANQTNGNVTIP